MHRNTISMFVATNCSFRSLPAAFLHEHAFSWKYLMDHCLGSFPGFPRHHKISDCRKIRRMCCIIAHFSISSPKSRFCFFHNASFPLFLQFFTILYKCFSLILSLPLGIASLHFPYPLLRHKHCKKRTLLHTDEPPESLHS